VARPLEQPVGVGFSRQTLPGDFELLVAAKRDGGTRILDGSEATRRGQNGDNAIANGASADSMCFFFYGRNLFNVAVTLGNIPKYSVESLPTHFSSTHRQREPSSHVSSICGKSIALFSR